MLAASNVDKYYANENTTLFVKFIFARIRCVLGRIWHRCIDTLTKMSGAQSNSGTSDSLFGRHRQSEKFVHQLVCISVHDVPLPPLRRSYVQGVFCYHFLSSENNAQTLEFHILSLTIWECVCVYAVLCSLSLHKHKRGITEIRLVSMVWWRWEGQTSNGFYVFMFAVPQMMSLARTKLQIFAHPERATYRDGWWCGVYCWCMHGRQWNGISFGCHAMTTMAPLFVWLKEKSQWDFCGVMPVKCFVFVHVKRRQRRQQ